MTEVRIVGLTKRFDVGSNPITAIAGLDLVIDSGSAVAVVGASGSGKSTLLHLIGGIESPDEGSIRVGEVEIATLSSALMTRYRQRIGFVFQRFHLIHSMTALENVMLPLLAERSGRGRQSRARAALDSVGLSRWEASYPAELSGGQQQRVAIARAMVVQPKLILADEPTGNLDSATAQEIVGILLDLRRSIGTTLLVVTHDADIAARCDTVVQLIDGHLATC